MSSDNSQENRVNIEDIAALSGQKLDTAATETRPVASEPAPEVEIPTPAVEDDFSKLQELLFGDQLRAVNQKIMLVHKDFKQTIGELDRKIEQRLQALEAKQTGGDMQDRIVAVEQAYSASKTAIEDRLTQVQQEFSRQLHELRSELQTQLDGTRSTIADSRVDRAALSELLGGIAKQISSIDEIPTLAPSNEAAHRPNLTVDERSA